jgi:flavorubredoxin
MFTYINDDKLIFTCDFLGTHYCEPYVFDYMMNKKHTNDFYKEVKNYYDAIFGPFPKHVQYGLNKIKSLDVNIACVSHGPILTKKSQLNSIIKLYDDLSIQQKNNSYLPIFYASAYGYTKQLAQSIADGISSAIPSIEVKLYDINEHSINELSNIINSVNYFGIGSPTINRSVVAPIMNLLSTIDGINSGDKQAFVFGSFG